MQHEDWLVRQIEAVGRALAAVLGAGPEARAEAEAQLDALLGVKLSVLEVLPPAQAVRLTVERFGERQPERLRIAVQVLDALIQADPTQAVRLGRLRASLAEAYAQSPSSSRNPLD